MNDSYDQIITTFPLFRGYTIHGARMLLESGTVKEHDPVEVLFKEGDSPTFVLLALTGKLQVFVEHEGRTLILADVGPGTILGELALL